MGHFWPTQPPARASPAGGGPMGHFWPTQPPARASPRTCHCRPPIWAPVKATPELLELVRRQHGAVSRGQLFELGVPRRTVGRLPDAQWDEVHPGVFVAHASSDSFLRRVWAGFLAARRPCAVSHEAAARLHGLAGFASAGVVLTVARHDHHRLEDVRIHQISDMFDRPEQVMTMKDLVVSTVPRTFVDLSRVAKPGRLNYALEEALSSRVTTLDAVASAVYALARPGKPGLRTIVGVLARHQPGPSVPGSQLERSLLELLRRGGEPPPALQVPLPGRSLDGLVDCYYDRARLILEADGRKWHARITQMKRDIERDAAAAQAGCQTLRLLYEHIVGDPAGTLRTIRATRLMREAQLGVAA